MDTKERALLRLHLTPRLGRTALFKLHQHFGDFESAVTASPRARQAAGLSTKLAAGILPEDSPLLQLTCEKLADLKVRLISFWDEDYPPLLRQIHDPPALLYLRGQLPAGEGFAIVGSRKASHGALQLTRQLAASLAGHDLCIVSGLARGIDSAAHRGALDAGGATIAVLGCGIDRIYPPENSRLFHDILQHNAILSEYPPGTPPLAGHFPGRNRIISGLCRGVLIVEAAEGSGSLLTGEFALEQGRELFAIPGDLHNPNSHGTNQLLKEGAQLVTEASDILQALWPSTPPRLLQQGEEQFAAKLSGATMRVYQMLGHQPLHVDEIGRGCGLTPMEVSAILLDLELRGGVQLLPGAQYIRAQSR